MCSAEVDSDYHSALSLAIDHGRKYVVRLLLATGAKVDADSLHADVVQLLVHARVDLNARNQYAMKQLSISRLNVRVIVQQIR